MIYRVIVETPMHGQLFSATCGPDVIEVVLHAAVSAIDRIAEDLHSGRLPIRFTVDVQL